MKLKRFLTIIAIFLLLCCAFCGCGSPKYKISIDTSSLNIDDNVINVEYGEQFTLPLGSVVDEQNNEFDLEVKYSLINQTTLKNIAKRVPIYNLENNTEYVLTYFVESEEKIDNVVYKIKCSDTLAPIITTTGLRTNYDINSTVEFNLANIVDASGYKENTLEVKLICIDNNNEFEFTKIGSVYSYKVTQKGNYKIVINVDDNVGNKADFTHNFVVNEQYIEPIVDNVLWGFENTSAISNVSAKSDSDTFEIGISNEKTNGSQNSLKLDLKANTRAKFLLLNANATNVDKIGDVVFKVYSTKLVDEFRVCNTIDYKEINFDYKVLENEWKELRFTANLYYVENTNITELQFNIWVEEDATIYIDGIYYTDYVAPWQDETLTNGQLANFNSLEYADRLGKVTDKQNSSFGGLTEILLEGDGEIPTGANGGVLKFTSTTTIAESLTVDYGYTMDGFYYDCGKKVYINDLSGIYLKINFNEYVWSGLHIALVSDMGTDFHWHTMKLGEEGGYEYVFIPYDQLKIDKDATYFTGMHIRLTKTVDEPKTAYFDEIGMTFKSTDKPTYQFDKIDSVDQFMVSSYASGVVCGIVADEQAVDGFALKAGTGNIWSINGFEINFDDIDVTKYSSILLRVRTKGNMGIYLNGDYSKSLKWGTIAEYAELDILQLAKDKPMEIENNLLKSIGFAVTNHPNTYVYVDKITFVEKTSLKNLTYQFDSATSQDLSAVKQYLGGKIDGVVEDANATDGFALKAGSVNNWSANGFVINFEDKDVTQYSSINIRFRVKGNAGTALSMYVNDTYFKWCSNTSYEEIDILALAQEKSVTFDNNLLNAIRFSGESQPNVDIFVDYITFVTK